MVASGAASAATACPRLVPEKLDLLAKSFLTLMHSYSAAYSYRRDRATSIIATFRRQELLSCIGRYSRLACVADCGGTSSRQIPQTIRAFPGSGSAQRRQARPAQGSSAKQARHRSSSSWPGSPQTRQRSGSSTRSAACRRRVDLNRVGMRYSVTAPLPRGHQTHAP